MPQKGAEGRGGPELHSAGQCGRLGDLKAALRNRGGRREEVLTFPVSE